MTIKVALAGNPNCGKTTLFNDLTGSSQYVGNWPGVTVEKKEGRLKGSKDIVIADLPGIYSLSPYTLEEVVSRDYVMNERPDVILNILDASNIERNLYLTTQLLETGVPVVIALNMIDIVEKIGDRIDEKALSKELGCDVVCISALKGTGCDELTESIIKAARIKAAPAPREFGPRVEKALAELSGLLGSEVPDGSRRWFLIKLFERDEKATETLGLGKAALIKAEEITAACEADMDDDSESIITNGRYEYITRIIPGIYTRKDSGLTPSDKIDRIVTNRWLALPIFAAVMFVVYFVSVTTVGALATDWTNDTLFGDWIMGGVSSMLEKVGAAEWLSSLIVDGIIGGVGSVLGFIPQMFVLFFFLSILEDCGYMARVAFILDRIFRKFGLSGKSFIPMLISSGCGVPGIMASRTIENEKDRRMTIMLTTFIPCGAKVPIIALIGGALFRDAAWVAPAVYFTGVAMIVVSGVILKKTRLFAGDPAPFVMELPKYLFPGFTSIFLHVWERGKAFVIKAGTVIFVACGVIWFLSNFNWSLEMVGSPESILASIGNVIAPVFAPLGFGNWQSAVASLAGLAAKENVVGTFGVLLGISDAAENDPQLLEKIAAMFTSVSAFSFVLFNMLCAPCFAAVSAIKREMGGWKWTIITIGYQTMLAYVVAFVINQLGSVIFLGEGFGVGAVISVILLGAVFWLIFRSYKPGKNTTKTKSKVVV